MSNEQTVADLRRHIQRLTNALDVTQSALGDKINELNDMQKGSPNKARDERVTRLIAASRSLINQRDAALDEARTANETNAQFERLLNEWHEKTEWIQAVGGMAGEHRADAIKRYVDKLSMPTDTVTAMQQEWRALQFVLGCPMQPKHRMAARVAANELAMASDSLRKYYLLRERS